MNYHIKVRISRKLAVVTEWKSVSGSHAQHIRSSLWQLAMLNAKNRPIVGANAYFKLSFAHIASFSYGKIQM